MSAKSTWPALLTDFTHRNAGRRARLQLIDPELGSQWQELDYPLMGIAYDPRDDRVEIMLGYLGSTELHLTHTIATAAEIDVLQPTPGHGETVRISHGSSQTLLHMAEPA